jgi:hypothetical protein
VAAGFLVVNDSGISGCLSAEPARLASKGLYSLDFAKAGDPELFDFCLNFDGLVSGYCAAPARGAAGFSGALAGLDDDRYWDLFAAPSFAAGYVSAESRGSSARYRLEIRGRGFVVSAALEDDPSAGAASFRVAGAEREARAASTRRAPGSAALGRMLSFRLAEALPALAPLPAFPAGTYLSLSPKGELVAAEFPDGAFLAFGEGGRAVLSLGSRSSRLEAGDASDYGLFLADRADFPGGRIEAETPVPLVVEMGAGGRSPAFMPLVPVACRVDGGLRELAEGTWYDSGTMKEIGDQARAESRRKEKK